MRVESARMRVELTRMRVESTRSTARQQCRALRASFFEQPQLCACNFGLCLYCKKVDQHTTCENHTHECKNHTHV
jgi:hypothetical protein